MKVYILFSRTGTWLSRILGLFGGFKYMHSSISFDPTLKEMYSFGRIKPHNPLIGGFVKESFYRDWETDRKSTRLNSSH